MLKFVHYQFWVLGLLMATVLLPAGAFAAAVTVQGKVNGVDCAMNGGTCPIDKLDPHVVLEPDFVVQDAQGYYFMTNLPRDIKVRYVLEEVEVVGDLNEKYRSIVVDEFKVKKGSEYKVVWDKDIQVRTYWDNKRPGATRP